MASARRAALVDAGISLVLEQRFQDLLASVDTRSITERAGVTTGSFFHHFRNRAEFSVAVAERFRELWDRSAAEVAADLEAMVGGDVGDVRSVAQADWDKVKAAEVEGTLLHLLWAARDQPLAADGDCTAGDVLRGAYEHLLETAMPAFRRTLVAMEREPMPPFGEIDLAVTLTALADGIQMRQAVQPEVVRDTLFADLSAGLLAAMTRPASERGHPVELAEVEAALSVSRLDRRPVAGEGETWRRIADAAAPLFDQRGVGEVRVADIATAAGVSPSTVHHHFSSVAEVAACGWVRFLPELEKMAARPLTASEGPVRRMEEVLARIVEIGRAHRGALEGLMSEAISATGDGPSLQRSLWNTVPLSGILAPLFGELRARGRLRRRLDGDVLARTVVQLLVMRVLTTPDDPVERMIDDTLGLVLDGALSTDR